MRIYGRREKRKVYKMTLSLRRLVTLRKNVHVCEGGGGGGEWSVLCIS